MRSHCIEPAQHHVGIANPAGLADPWPLSPLAGEYLPQMHSGGMPAGKRASSGRAELRRHGSNRRRPVPRPPRGASRPARAQPRPVSRAAALVFISSSPGVIVAAHCPPLTCRDRCMSGTEGRLQASGRLQAASEGSRSAQDRLRRPTWPRGPGLRRPLRAPAHACMWAILACTWRGLLATAWTKALCLAPPPARMVWIKPVRRSGTSGARQKTGYNRLP